jgi:hypothetical protein
MQAVFAAVLTWTPPEQLTPSDCPGMVQVAAQPWVHWVSEDPPSQFVSRWSAGVQAYSF